MQSKNFVLVFQFNTKKGPVKVYRELQGPPVSVPELRQQLREGAAAPVEHKSYSVQYCGSGRYFDTPQECIAYLTSRWKGKVLYALGCKG